VAARRLPAQSEADGAAAGACDGREAAPCSVRRGSSWEARRQAPGALALAAWQANLRGTQEDILRLPTPPFLQPPPATLQLPQPSVIDSAQQSVQVPHGPNLQSPRSEAMRGLQWAAKVTWCLLLLLKKAALMVMSSTYTARGAPRLTAPTSHVGALV
jgi:hypothetical protein